MKKELIVLVLSIFLFYTFMYGVLGQISAAINPPFKIGYSDINNEGIELGIQNEGGETYTIQNVSIGSCGSNSSVPAVIAPGEMGSIELACPLIDIENFKGHIMIEYRKSDSSTNLASAGVMADLATDEELKALYYKNISKLNAPFYLISYRINSTGILLEIKNNGRETYNLTRILVSNCGENTNMGSLASGQRSSIFLECSLAGEEFQGDINLFYRNIGSSTDMISSGAIYSESGKVGGEDDQDNPNQEEQDNECNGCLLEGKCVQFGHREEGKYCDSFSELKNQKQKKESCEDNFECQSNICSKNACINKGFFRKIMDFFKGLFGGD
jgi:hypothetical protein